MARRQGAPKPSRGGSGRASSGRGSKGPQRSQGYQGKRQQDSRLQCRSGRPQQGAPRPAGRGDARRGGSKGDLIEGRRAVSEALDLGLPVMRALIQKDSGNADPALTELARRLAVDGVEVERVAKPILDSLSSHGAHQGVMLRVRPYRYASLRDVIDAAGEGNALVIVLDHVTDEGNFGAIVRTAEVVGAAGVVVAKSRAARVGVGAYKTSAGAVMHLPIAQVSNLATALDELKEHGFWAGGATEHAHDLVWDAPVSGRLALVMGSEGSGISRLVREHCDFEFKLPQRGVVESLNVAQATTAIAYEWLRRDMTGDTAAAAITDDAYETGYDLPDTSEFDFSETDLD
uniref:23S rRNA (guanosine(2251)-2'-O)-methyltransferase RlmB n=1 Tax=Parolsenella massiliensis TaxID=1871022 RepID=UPI0009352017|nr:23S rRNA (guanosine(2251)-2'-O)-methyltransferase RlmB [Parolsenella massiliensis]